MITKWDDIEFALIFRVKDYRKDTIFEQGSMNIHKSHSLPAKNDFA